MERLILNTAFSNYKYKPFKVRLEYSNEEVEIGTGPAEFTIIFKTRDAFLNLLAKGDLGFAEGYMDKEIEIEGDLLDVLSLAFTKDFSLPGYSVANKILGKAYTLLHPDDPHGSRKNIRKHYDVGNEFYQLWLDKNMQYTCAFFSHPDEDLESAQINKIEYIARKLELKEGVTCLELGCGWGGFSIYVAKKYGVRCTALNVSKAQIEYAREWAKREGVDDRVEFIEADYREATGVYDRVAVIGMVEHVGEGNYEEFASVVDRHLKDGGLTLWHFISRVKPSTTDPFTGKYIFPGGHIPALSEVIPAIEHHEFMIQDIDNLKLHYAKTLMHWTKRFREHEAWVKEHYGERFYRMWELYLVGATASFLYGELTLAQILMVKGKPKDLPLNRDYYLHPEKEVPRWKDWKSLS